MGLPHPKSIFPEWVRIEDVARGKVGRTTDEPGQFLGNDNGLLKVGSHEVHVFESRGIRDEHSVQYGACQYGVIEIVESSGDTRCMTQGGMVRSDPEKSTLVSSRVLAA